MNKRFIKHLLPVALLLTTSVAQATIFRVYPGESIQEAIDVAAPGDTVLVEPGDYRENAGGTYGLHITTDNLRLIGKVRKGPEGISKVRILPADDGQTDGGTGVYAAPEGCEYNEKECDGMLEGFYLRGFSVEGFGKNGIQTRWVDGFRFVRNESINNLNNGIYPTLSANGLVANNTSYGSLDTAMWVAGSENVRVVGNKLHSSVIGFEITVSNNVQVKKNQIYNNSVGVGLFHPGGAGNPPLPVMANWDIRNNDIYDNNRLNDAPAGSFQSELPHGIGILMLGVSDNDISRNRVSGNEFIGLGILGWCTANAATGAPGRCGDVVLGPLGANNNLVSRNVFTDNATNPPDPAANPLGEAAADIVYLQGPPFEDKAVGNCFKNNKPVDYSFTSLPDGILAAEGELPTDGC